MFLQRALRPFARISLRILAFNLLLVFLPIAGVLYLDTFERNLVERERAAMLEEARLVAAALGGATSLDTDAAQALIARHESASLGRPIDPHASRVRILEPDGHVVADSFWLRSRETVEKVRRSRVRKSRLYRAGAFLARPILRLVRPPAPPLEIDDEYERALQLGGPEVVRALAGGEGSAQRVTAGSGAVTLYEAMPIRASNRVTGAVLISKSTYPIQQNLYSVRLGVLRIFVASLVVALILSILVAVTIVRPLRQLRLDAHTILSPRGRLRGHFRGSKKLDEIGDLSRALERLTRRLEEHLQFIDSFASDLSHELKNPLAAIRTATEMLEQVDDPRDRARFVRMIHQDVARIEHLLSGLRDVTMIDTQLAREPREVIELGEFVGRVMETYSLRVDRDARLELDSQAGVKVLASPHRLAQVVTNLLDNALSFTPSNGVIRIGIARSGDAALLRVIDEGEGIPQGHLDRIFDRFFSYRPRQKGRADHSGLGLAIVKAIVEGYGGAIRAENVQPHGAAFEVQLPAA